MSVSIAVNAVYLNTVRPSGLHRHVDTLLSGLAQTRHSFVALTGDQSFARAYPEHVRLTPRFLGKPGTIANTARFLWYQFWLPKMLRRERAELFFSPAFEGMLRPCTRQIVTVHDLLPLAFPEQYPRIYWYFKLVLPRLLKASTAVFVDSDATRQDLNHYYGELGVPIHVVHLGVRPDSFRMLPSAQVDAVKRKFELDKYVLFVGELRRYKNIRSLIDAMRELNVPDVKLVIVGRVHHLDREIVDYPRVAGVAEKVKFLGFSSAEELPALYQGAQVFAFPSLKEGFGLPVIEAMACDCPVAAANVSSMPEICGDAAMLFDPTNPSDIAAKIRAILVDANLSATLRARGRKRAAQFSDMTSTQQALDLCARYAAAKS